MDLGSINKDLIIAFLGAIGSLIPVVITAAITYRRAMSKMRAENDAERLKLQKELMDARAEFKARTDASDNQKAMIQAIIEQGHSARNLAENVVKIVAAIEENTRATNKLAEKVDDNKQETTKLDRDIDNFAAHLVRATRTMEEAKGEVEATAGLIGASSKETQANSSKLADAILKQLAELRELSEDTLAIVKDIDQRVKALETKPDPVPPPPAILIAPKPEPVIPPPASEASPVPPVAAQ